MAIDFNKNTTNIEKKIPIVVLNYNDYDTAADFLEHFEEEGFKDILQLIFVDNASTDDSYKRICKKFSKLGIFLQSRSNRGYAAGNNVGLRYAYKHLDFDAIIISNPDVTFDRNAIESLYTVLKKYENVKIVSATMLDESGNKQVSAWKLPSFARETFSSLFLVNHIFKLDKKLYSDEELDHIMSKVDVVNGSFFMADAEAFRRANLFDESTFLYCEENILASKLKNMGYSEAIVNDISYTHKHNATIGKTFKKKLQRYKILQKSRIAYFEKCLNVGRFRIMIFKIISTIGLVERAISCFIFK